MKKILFGLIILSQSVFANASTKKIEILECNDSVTRIHIILDSINYVEGSGYKDPVSAGIWFNYSVAPRMVCVGVVNGDDYSNLKCAGYYNNKELTELEVTNEGSKIIANWTTSEGYGSLKKQTECILKTDMQDHVLKMPLI